MEQMQWLKFCPITKKKNKIKHFSDGYSTINLKKSPIFIDVLYLHINNFSTFENV
jgi:hypothetical protein